MHKFTTITPHITEKSTQLEELGKYIVTVPKDATKVDIKNTIKHAYGVEVEKINTIRTTKKTRLIGRGRIMTKRPSEKKVIITIKKGQKLDLIKIKEKK